MFPGSLVRRCGKVLVTSTAAAALGNDQPLVRMLEVVHQLASVLVIDKRSDRHLQDDVFALRASAVRTLTVTSALCLVLWIESEVHQRIVLLAGFHNDVATASAITAGRTSARHKFLAPESHAAIPATTGRYPNFCFINKHGGFVSQKSPVISLGISSDLRLQTSVFFQSKRPRHRRGLLRNLHSIRSR